MILVPMEDCGCQIEKERDRYQRRKAAARSGGCGFVEMGIGLYGQMGSLDGGGGGDGGGGLETCSSGAWR